MHPRIVLSVGNFFFSLFSTLAAYITLPFLASYMPAAYTGFVVALGALGAIICFSFLPHLVARYGAQQLALIFAVLEVIALFALATTLSAFAAILLIAVMIALQPLLSYELDLLLEATVAEEGVTGRVRTLFLTAWNVASLAAPLLIGALLANSNAYARIFLAAAAALVPFIVLFAARKLPRTAIPKLSHMRDTILCIVRDHDLAAVTVAHFLLYLFYVWAPLYVPIYLHNVLHIPWSSLGWMFAVMLIPYTLIEYPAGWIADHLIGDKELMFAGFLITGAALASMSVISVSSPLIFILVILVFSRIGAALVESMTEAHFFRRVSERDVNSVSIFRGVWPLADFVAPILGSLLLLAGGYETFFLSAGGFIALAGGVTTLLIKDFR